MATIELELDEELLCAAEVEASARNTTVNALVLEILRDAVGGSASPSKKHDYPFPTLPGGRLPDGFPIHGSPGKIEEWLEAFEAGVDASSRR